MLSHALKNHYYNVFRYYVQWRPRFFFTLLATPLPRDFEIPSTKGAVSPSPSPLNLGWPWALLWPMECDYSEDVPLLILDLRTSACFLSPLAPLPLPWECARVSVLEGETCRAQPGWGLPKSLISLPEAPAEPQCSATVLIITCLWALCGLLFSNTSLISLCQLKFLEVKHTT